MDVVDEGRLPQLVEATRTAGAWIVPTLALWETALYGDHTAAELRTKRPEARYMPPEVVEEWEREVDDRVATARPETNRRVRSLLRTILTALRDGGAPILLGTDSPHLFTVPGFAMQHEMRVWVDVGMTPYQVLETGTRRVAEYFDATDEFGSVAVGLRADLLLLTENPIDDIEHVASRAGVMVSGRWLPERQIQDRLAGIATFYGN